MGFLESIQHGLEKASKEAARITKIHHLQNVVNDLSFKSAQEGQHLIARALELHRSGQLPQAELAEICEQITTYQQQINEVQAEIQKLHDEQEEPPAPPEAPGYAAYPPAPPVQGYAPVNVPQPYPPYSPPPANYPPYQAAQPPYPGYAPQVPPSSEVPTKPGKAPASPPVQNSSSEAPTKPGAKAKAHKSKGEDSEEASATAENSRGSYEEGVLPPVYSPFAKADTADETKK